VAAPRKREGGEMGAAFLVDGDVTVEDVGRVVVDDDGDVGLG